MRAFTTIPLTIVGLFVALAIHELGHLVAGLLVGFRFWIFALGPLIVERSESGALRVRINRVPAYAGGIAGTYPIDAVNLPTRFALAVAAGPVASLVLAVSAALLLAHSPHLPSALRVLLLSIRLTSGLLFFATAIPFWSGPFVTDGWRFFRVLSSGVQGRRELSFLNLVALQMNGTAASSWDPALVTEALLPADGSMFEHAAQLFAYRYALDIEDVERAGAHLDRAIVINSKLPRAFRISCLLEAAYFEAHHRHRSTIAAAHADEVPFDPPPGVGFLESDRLRAKAAIAQEIGDDQTAAESVARALQLLPAWNVWARARLLSLCRVGHRSS